jgi:hypothetical protein
MDLFSGLETKNRVSAAERKAAEARETERKPCWLSNEVKDAFLKMEEAWRVWSPRHGNRRRSVKLVVNNGARKR